MKKKLLIGAASVVGIIVGIILAIVAGLSIEESKRQKCQPS